MRLFYSGKDGGPESKVWGFWLIEWKRLFSVAVLRFEDGSRDAYHNHAFNALSWVLKGNLIEGVFDLENKTTRWHTSYRPSTVPIWTPRNRMHQVTSNGRTYVLTFRGPWTKTWKEYVPAYDRILTLTNGREIVNG